MPNRVANMVALLQPAQTLARTALERRARVHQTPAHAPPPTVITLAGGWRTAMIRGLSLALAASLLILWVVALNNHATAWLTWLDGLGALAGFMIAAGPGVGPGRGISPGALVALAIGLGVLSTIGLARHAEVWLTSLTLMLACAFLLVGIADRVSGQGVTRTPPRPVQ